LLPLYVFDNIALEFKVTDVRAEQPEKAELPMLVTLLGIVTDVRLEQPQKAELPMLVTLLGIVTDMRPEQPLKASEPMLVTLLGITVFLHPATRVFVAVLIIALQLLRLSYLGLSDATMMDVKPEQSEKA
jgi:hypothetical protein